jgi:hypothetical protein
MKEGARYETFKKNSSIYGYRCHAGANSYNRFCGGDEGPPEIQRRHGKNCRKRHLFGIFEGKNFKPNKAMKLGELNKILRNILGKDKVNISKKERAKAKKKITDNTATKKFVKVAKDNGIKITWDGQSVTLTRGLAALYFVRFINLSPRFKPIR